MFMVFYDKLPSSNVHDVLKNELPSNEFYEVLTMKYNEVHSILTVSSQIVSLVMF